MSTIILCRHGRPAWDYRTAIAGRAFAEWRRGEDLAPLDDRSHPSPELKRLAQTASRFVTSPLRRSLESAQRLRPDAAVFTSELFREAASPCSFRWGRGAHLRPDLWAAVARSAWFCGWSEGGESLAAARERASRAAALLTDPTATHDVTLVVGHGMMNILIGHVLRANGWRGPRIPSPRHWSFGIYRR
ncbi:MAG TPA: histidine phosphatase family protein [Gemmatimonadales bacterium]|nr:histidine phosphatase family protein [Gemmatimonadales bacterium]